MTVRMHIFSLLEKNISSLEKPCIVGISGAYASGKTVFTKEFAEYLTDKGYKVQVIHYDDFHNPLPSIHWSKRKGDEIDAFYNKAFNQQKLVDEILIPIKEKGYVKKKVACLDWDIAQNTHIVPFDIDGTTIVLLEGVLLFRPELINYFDYKIFLDITVQEILDRGRKRDVPKAGEGIMEKYVTRYIPVHQRHLKEDRPKEVADILIDNSDYTKPVIYKRRD